MNEPAPRLDIDTDRLRSDLESLNSLADSFGQKIVTAFSSAIIHGKKLSGVLRELMLSLAQTALSAALRPLGQLIGGIIPDARSGILPDAGIVKSPGPPLSRSGGGGGNVNVTVNISTPDVQGFRQSQSQIAAMLTRAVARGQRNL